MPVLHQRREDGGYYIVGQVGRGFATWQVKPAALARLRECGVAAGDIVPDWLHFQLLDEGLLFNRGEGRLDDGSSPLPLKARELPCLEITTAGDGNSRSWSLRVLFPELPAYFVDSLEEEIGAQAASDCGVTVDETRVVGLESLRPKGGGTACEVSPHAAGYGLKPVGPWSDCWGALGWGREIAGLRAATIFWSLGQGKSRLPQSELLVPEATYYLVANVHEARRVPKGVLPKASAWSRRPLGAQDGWEVWELTFPPQADPEIRRWCDRLGHRLHEKTVWQTRITAPPPLRHWVGGMPVLPKDSMVQLEFEPLWLGPMVKTGVVLQVECNGLPVQRAALTLEPPASGVRRTLRIGGKTLVPVGDSSHPIGTSFPVGRTGLYTVRPDKPNVLPLRFVVEDR